MHRLIIFLFFCSWILETKLMADEYAAKDRIARSSRRRSRSENFGETKRSDRKSDPKKDAYFKFLPFGGAHFLQGKNYMGTALAAGQAGSLLLYYDRLQQVRTANDDVASVMNNNKSPADPSTFQYLDTNEKYVLKAQKEAQLFLFSFIGLYTFGVVDAVFDPFAAYTSSKKKKKKPLDFDSPKRRDIDADFDDEPGFTQREPIETETKLSFMVWQNQQQAVYGFTLKAEL